MRLIINNEMKTLRLRFFLLYVCNDNDNDQFEDKRREIHVNSKRLTVRQSII